MRVKVLIGVWVLLIGWLPQSIAAAQGGSSTSGAGMQAGTTWAAYQVFEYGEMIWREDTGEILVLVSRGLDVYYFAEEAYRDLPDNPVSEEPPEGLFKPVRGFGRVWGNFPAVHTALGWALDHEVGFTAVFRPTTYTAGGLAQTALTLPNGYTALLREDGSWQYEGGPRPYWSLRGTTPATYQDFEHGFMVFWGETGTIWVLTDAGGWWVFESLEYGALPGYPTMLGLPPEGLVLPILGFGKVWYNFDYVRAALGWATTQEQGYVTTVRRVDVLTMPEVAAYNFEMLLPDGAPDGAWISIRTEGYWTTIPAPP